MLLGNLEAAVNALWIPILKEEKSEGLSTPKKKTINFLN